MKIAACTKMLGDYDLLQTLRIVGMIGYQGVEIFCTPQHLPADVSDSTLREARRIADGYGVEVVCLATYVGGGKPDQTNWERDLAAFRRYAQIGEVLGTRHLRIGLLRRADVQASPEIMDRYAAWARDACRVAAERGQSGVFETHEGQIADSAAACLDLLARVDAPNVGITWDPGSLAVDPAIECGPKAVRQLGAAIRYVQLHDFVRTATSRRYVFSGEGVVDYVGTIAGLREIGFDGYIGAECHRPTDDWYDGRGLAEQEYRRILPLLA
jgi:L-ribulose-5-phosphate 3-epimerase